MKDRDDDDELDALLRERLPRYAAPAALRARLAAHAAAPTATPATPTTTAAPAAPAAPTAPTAPSAPTLPTAPARRRRTRGWWLSATSALAAAMLVLAALSLWKPPFLQRDGWVDEAVNDHLRVVVAQHPVEIESGGIHQVRPWFTGRLDFAPPVAFSGDDDFPLRGGSVGYFRDRRAAVFVFGRRLHTISLTVFRADGLGLPAHASRTERGFNVLEWRDGELGWMLVSDVSLQDLQALASKLR